MKRVSVRPTRTVGRRPKSRRGRSDTRSAILAAACRIFARHGILGTSMREVAETAKVNSAMIYYHFKDKSDLYDAVLADSFSRLNAIWNDKLFSSSDPARKKIQKYVENYIRFAQTNDDTRRIMATQFAGSGNPAACEKYLEDTYTRLMNIFRDGMKKGELKKSDPSLAVYSLFGILVYNTIMQPMVRNIHGKISSLSPKKFGAYVARLMLNGMAS